MRSRSSACNGLPACAGAQGRRPGAGRRSAPRAAIAPASSGVVDERGAVQRHEQVVAGRQAEAHERGLGLDRGRIATSVSIMMLPTSWIARRVMPSAQQVARAPPREWMNSSRDSESATTRLISSGIVAVEAAQPGLDVAHGKSSLAATRAAAMVELTSPGTSTTSGSCSSSNGSKAFDDASGLLGVRRPSRRRACGRARGQPSSSKKSLRHRRGRSAGRCGSARARSRRGAPPMRQAIGAIFMKFGRVPTTDTILRRLGPGMRRAMIGRAPPPLGTSLA